jgi:transposase
MVSQLHQLLLELIPGGAKKDLSAAQAKALLATVRPREAAGKARRRVAAELIADLERVYRRKRAADKELKQLVAGTGSTLMDLHGIGPSGAARLLVEVGDITRFPSRAHFVSWNGTAPIDASSGEQVRHRLSRRRQPADQPRPAHHGHRATAQPNRRPRLLRPQESPMARRRWKPCAASNAGCPTSSTGRWSTTPRPRQQRAREDTGERQPNPA